MKYKKEEKNGQAFLQIEGDVTIYELKELRKVMISCLRNRKDLILDLGGVKLCDTAGIQLLLSARKTFVKEKKIFHVERISDELCQIFQRAGLNPEDVVGSIGRS